MTRLALAFTVVALLSPVALAAKRPNFAFMFVDDQRYDAMSVVQKEHMKKTDDPQRKAFEAALTKK